MDLRTALNECLSHVRQGVPAFDEAALRAPLQLPVDSGEWGVIWSAFLDTVPCAVILRSAALKRASIGRPLQGGDMYTRTVTTFRGAYKLIY